MYSICVTFLGILRDFEGGLKKNSTIDRQYAKLRAYEDAVPTV